MAKKLKRGKPYRDDHDAESEEEEIFKEPPFSEEIGRQIEAEVARIEKAERPQCDFHLTTRELWLVTRGAGRISPTYGFIVKRSEYMKFSELWNKYTEWHAKKDYASNSHLAALDQMYRTSGLLHRKKDISRPASIPEPTAKAASAAPSTPAKRSIDPHDIDPDEIPF